MSGDLNDFIDILRQIILKRRNDTLNVVIEGVADFDQYQLYLGQFRAFDECINAIDLAINKMKEDKDE